MDEPGSDSEYSDTSGTTSSSSSSNSSNESLDDGTELTKIEKHILRLPKGLCENPEIFKEFFSLNTWESLPSNFQAYLKNKFLPHFEENNEIEQERTLQLLFNNDITRFFSSPLMDLQKNLEEGNYRPDVLKLRESIRKSKRKEQRFQECERVSQLAKMLMISREKMLRSAYDSSPGSLLKIDQIVNSTPKMNNSAAAVRAKKRYHEEITNIASHVGLKDLSDHDDEDELKYVHKYEKLGQEQLNQIYSNNETKIIGTMSRRKNDGFTTPNYGITALNDSNFKQILMAHKKRKLEEPERPEFDTNDIRLRDVHARTQNTSNYKKSPNVGRPAGRKSLSKAAKQDQPDDVSIARSPEPIQMGGLPQTQNFHTVPNQQIYQQQPPPPSLHQQQQQHVFNNTHGMQSSGIVRKIKLENSSDSEENTDAISTSKKHVTSHQVPLTTTPTYHRLDENPKKKNLPQPHYNNKNSKKVMLNVNGTAVPEAIQNITNINMKDKPSNADLIGLPQFDLDESGNIDILNDIKHEPAEISAPELMQETHACFLSLIRDIFCSTPNHRMKLDDLKGKIYTWLSNPITALNDWYCLADNWLNLIPSAIHFLAGDFVDQPEDFVPYVEFKPQLNIYQWIGAGRDSDQHLMQLCNYWLNRRNEMGCKPLQKFELNARKSSECDESLANERPISPPPPRCPTNWTVQPATPEMLEEFRIQERQRFENPHKAFTYRMHGYESVVGPVKGVYTQILSLAKARGHNMLVQDRPSYVTILTLVRDATARLPNGEGTRADICELLKSSQYICPDAQDSVLQTTVSGALDRMHTEHDPCVRYDTKRKIWIYLHRNRSEEEFERLHQESQGIAKPKKVQTRKIKTKVSKIMPIVPTSSESQAAQVVKSVASNSTTAGTITTTTTTTTSLPLKASPTSPKKTPTLAMKTPLPKLESFDQTDAEAAIDAQASPAIVHKPSSTVAADLKPQKTVNKKTTVQANIPSPSLTKTIAVANPSTNQIQTVTSVPNPTITVSSKQLTTILPNSTMIATGTQAQGQINVGGKKISKPILINQNQSASIVSQVGQTGQGFIIPININNSDQIKSISSIPSALIAASNLNPKLMKSGQPPALASTVNARSAAVIQQSGKNFVRVATTTSQAGKSLINPQVAAANITLQQQKMLNATAAGGIAVQQKNTTSTIAATSPSGIRTQIQKGTPGVSLISNATAIKSNQSLTASQQKQILQNLISHQQKQQRQQNATSNVTPNTVVLPSGNINTIHQITGIQQNKPIIISSSQAANIQSVQQQQQVHKIIASSAAAAGLATNTVSMTGAVQNPTNANINNAAIVNIANQQQTGANLINPQIIQIHQTAGGQAQIGKVQAINTTQLTAQQQQNLLQSIKQQQLKLQQNQQQQQQSLIIKQQPVFQQIQKSSPNTPTTVSVSVGTGSPKTVTPLMGTNVPNLITTPTTLTTTNVVQNQSNIVKQQATLLQQQGTGKTVNVGTQQQTITRVLKPGTSIIQPQVISSTGGGVRTQAGNPLMAKVLTNSSGQIISLESLLQKQGIAPGTALRVTGAKPTQTSLIQLTGSPGSLPQYAVVSQGRNLISVGTPQRMVTTQASAAGNVVSSRGSNVLKVNEQKTVTAAINSTSAVQHQAQNQPKVITANQIQSLTAQQLVNAKVLGKAGSATGLRMVNASNLNIAHIRGKPVIIASKPTNVANQQASQNVILQNPGNNTNLVIGGQTLKVQGNVVSPANVQVLNQSSSQSQTVVLGNQILKVQQSPHTIKQQTGSSVSNIISNSVSNINNSGINSAATTSIASTNTGGSSVVVSTNANLSQAIPKTVVLGSTGQTIRVQSPQVHVQGATAGGVSSQGQPMLLGTTVKGSSMKGSSGQQRVVLAVQSGGQILLPPGFQGGAINLKSLQGLKVVSIGQQQQQQQNKGQQSDEHRPVFAQIVTAPQAPRPPNPGGD